MSIPRFGSKLLGFYQRKGANLFFKNPLAMRLQQPLISFTFDDFPRSALLTGGCILKRFGLAGTYYVSLGLLGKHAPSGPVCLHQDLEALLEQGHELGCHTFNHFDSWETSTSVFMASIVENQRSLDKLFPGASFRTFSYPINPPRIWTKRRVAGHFACSRGGGQTLNVGTVDLNYLSAFFLEKSRDNPRAVKNLIDLNRRLQGWLILATHDVNKEPSPWGCTPEFFEDIVKYALNSGARILPVVEAREALDAPYATRTTTKEKT